MLHPSRSLLIPSFINPILDLLQYQPFISSLYNSFFTIQVSSIHLLLFILFYHFIILFTCCCIYYKTLQLKTKQKRNKQKKKCQVNSNIHSRVFIIQSFPYQNPYLHLYPVYLNLSRLYHLIFREPIFFQYYKELTSKSKHLSFFYYCLLYFITL